MYVHESDGKLTGAGSAKLFVKENGDTVIQNRGILNDRELRKKAQPTDFSPKAVPFLLSGITLQV